MDLGLLLPEDSGVMLSPLFDIMLSVSKENDRKIVVSDKFWEENLICKGKNFVRGKRKDAGYWLRCDNWWGKLFSNEVIFS